MVKDINYKRGNIVDLFSARTLIFTAFMFLNLILVDLQSSPLRIVQIKIVGNENCYHDSMLETWEISIRRIIQEVGQRFQAKFGLQLQIKKFCYWQSDKSLRSTDEYLFNLIKKIPREGCDIVLGIINNNSFRMPFGISSYPHGYILLQNTKSKSKMKMMFMHELCHLFGAVDLNEEGSIMNIRYPGLRFDQWTARIISLNLDRNFDQNIFPLSEQKLDDAISLLKERAGLNRGEAELHLVLASLLFRKGDDISASIEIQKAMNLNPQLKDLPNYRGVLFQKQGNIDQAISEYKKALQFQSNRPEIHFNLGLAFAEKGRDEAAIEEYQKTLEFDPRVIRAYINLSYLFLKKGHVNEAIRTCRKALEIQSKSVEVLCSLASAVLFKKMLADEDTDAKHGLTTAQTRTDQINLVEEAVILGQKILALKPEQPEAYNILGIAFKFQNETEKAKREFKRAIELRPEYLEAHFNLGTLYLEEGILSKAAFHLHKTIEIDPNFADGYKSLSRILFLEKEYELSRGYQKKASELREKTRFSSTNLLILGKKSELERH